MFDRWWNGLHERHKPMCQDWRYQGFQRADQPQSIFRLRLKLVTLTDFFLFSFENTHSKNHIKLQTDDIKNEFATKGFVSFLCVHVWRKSNLHEWCVSHPFLLCDFVCLCGSFLVFFCCALIFRSVLKISKGISEHWLTFSRRWCVWNLWRIGYCFKRFNNMNFFNFFLVSVINLWGSLKEPVAHKSQLAPSISVCSPSNSLVWAKHLRNNLLWCLARSLLTGWFYPNVNSFTDEENEFL